MATNWRVPLNHHVAANWAVIRHTWGCGVQPSSCSTASAPLPLRFISLASKWLKAHLGFKKQQIPFNFYLLHVCRSWYFGLHLLCILVVLVLPVKSRRRQAKEQQDSLQKCGQTASSTDSNCNQEKATWGPAQRRAVQSAPQAGARQVTLSDHRTKYWTLWKPQRILLKTFQ